jgi:hypothetical protein
MNAYDQYGRPMQMVPMPGGGMAAVPVQAPSSQQLPSPQPKGEKIQPGALAQYYNDAASGIIVPEDMRIEDLQYRVQIDPLGNIIFQTASIGVLDRYQFILRGVMGWSMSPELVGAAGALVNFQIQEQGRSFTIFKRPVAMASLLQSADNSVRWDGVYITVPGTDIEVQWTVDTTRWPSLVGVSKEFGIQLIGDYVACAPRNN